MTETLLKNWAWKAPIAIVLIYLLHTVLFCPCDKLLSCKGHYFVLGGVGAMVTLLIVIQHANSKATPAS